MIFKFEVKILYKDNVNDPEGLTISDSANRIGFSEVKSIRSGKIFILEIESDNERNAKNITEEISDKLLAQIQLLKNFLSI